jgi:hypothetical protein
LFSISIKKLILQIENILYVPSKFFNKSLNDNLLIKYGEYGDIIIKTNKNNQLGKINLNNNQITNVINYNKYIILDDSLKNHIDMAFYSFAINS